MPVNYFITTSNDFTEYMQRTAKKNMYNASILSFPEFLRTVTRK